MWRAPAQLFTVHPQILWTSRAVERIGDIARTVFPRTARGRVPSIRIGGAARRGSSVGELPPRVGVTGDRCGRATTAAPMSRIDAHPGGGRARPANDGNGITFPWDTFTLTFRNACGAPPDTRLPDVFDMSPLHDDRTH
jgi:hypothetical protein